jgi:solute:Na+ symporter, SSS family
VANFTFMLLHTLDWLILVAFLLLSLSIGLYVKKKSASSPEEFFAAGGKMPWWLLGVSMVATTFATDTPNLVTNIVREQGIAGNWLWWSFLLTGLLTVFFYARLWKRSGVLTDIAFYELRYSGRPAAFLRGFRALYLGVFFNVLIIANVSLAAIKIGGVLLGLAPWQTLIIAGSVTVIYSSLGGLRGVLLTDFLQFGISLFGAIAAAVVAVNLPQVGGLQSLLAHPEVHDKLRFVPEFSNTEALVTLLMVPLFVQWWSVWYPGAEPGGGGYIAQRMLAAKNEQHALGSVLFFNVMHYAVRPWPWIIVALCSIIVFPDIQALSAAFPGREAIVQQDMAYPAMLTFLPVGLLGLVVTSLVAAYMSTISTHLNWGASYVVHDFYVRFLNPLSSPQQQVVMGRWITVIIMVAGSTLALFLESALRGFQILLQIGAGTGLLYILRWYWWRINAQSEIAAMVISFLVACYFAFLHTSLGFAALKPWMELCIGVGITTVGWLSVAYFTTPTNEQVLRNFYLKVKPIGKGWNWVKKTLNDDQLGAHPVTNFSLSLLGMLSATVFIYAFLALIGLVIMQHYFMASVMMIAMAFTGFVLYRNRDNF